MLLENHKFDLLGPVRKLSFAEFDQIDRLDGLACTDIDIT